MYKEELALNNLQWSMCHKTQPNQTEPNLLFWLKLYKEFHILND